MITSTRPVCRNALWQRHLAWHSGYCVPISIRRKMRSCSYRTREIVLLQVVIQRVEEREEEETSKVLVWISSLIIRIRKSQKLNWCRWYVQINNRFQRVINWQRSKIYCGWFSSGLSQSLLWCGLVGMHNIKLTRKRRKRYGIFQLSISHQHRQQLLKKRWNGHTNWPWNVENMKSLWPTI